MEAVAYAEQSLVEFGAAHRSGLVENPCRQCRGEGACGYVNGHPNDPDAPTYVDECDECGGSGNGICPGCDDLSCFLVAGDGRCADCVAFAAVELAEQAEQDERADDEAAYADYCWDNGITPREAA